MDDRELIQAGFRYALSLCHDRAEAKDLVQDSWLKLTRYPMVSRGLLFTAVRNGFIDARRRPRLVQLDETDLAGPLSAASHTRDELAVALAGLRLEEREAIYLSVVEGFTAQEIAELTDRSRNTVLSLIRRGKEKLRESLSEPEEEEPAREEVSS